MEGKRKGRLVAIALIKNNQDEILLLKRRDDEFPSEDGRWEFPGGGVEQGETLEEALQRECKEEIGINVSVVKKLERVYENSHVNKDGEEIYFIVHCFLCRPGEGDIKPSHHEVAEIRWLKEPEIAGLRILEGNKKFIELSKK